MKKILVPTDFSENAILAIDYAIALANQFGSTLTLLNLYKVYSSTGMFISVEHYMKEDAAEHMLRLMTTIEKHLVNGAMVETKIIRGDAVDVIAELADKSDYDLVVMGRQGASGLREQLFGSTTIGVIRKAETPVLVVPVDCRYKPFKTIVLALDQKGISYSGRLSALLQIAKAYEAKIHIFHKDDGDSDKGMDPSINLYFEGIDHSFHYELEVDNLVESINQFAEDYGANLLCLIRREREFLQKIFHKSVTKREILSSTVPLLILHDVA